MNYTSSRWILVNRQANDLADDGKWLISFRHVHMLPLQGVCPPRSVVTLVQAGQCFYTVVIAASLDRVYVLGDRIGGHRNVALPWTIWEGPRIYQEICRLHGWRPYPEDKVQVDSHRIDHEGPESGLNAALYAQLFILNNARCGPRGDLFRPRWRCGHITRLLMMKSLKTLGKDVLATYRLSRRLPYPPQESLWWNAFGKPVDLPDRSLADLEDILCGHAFQKALTLLDEASRTCVDCGREPLLDTAFGRGEGMLYPEEVRLSSGPMEDETEERESSDFDVSPDVLRNVGHLRVAKSTGLSRAPNRFPRPTLPPDLPKPSLPLWPPGDPIFDEYSSAPLLASEEDPDLREIDRQRSIYIFGRHHHSVAHSLSSSSDFRDFGFRILPRFACMFYRSPSFPMDPLKHILPVGVPRGYTPHTHSIASGLSGNNAPSDTPFIPGLDEEAHPSSVEQSPSIPSDACIMSLQEMLTEAGAPGSKEGHSLFVRGRTFESRKYVAVDPERDAVPLTGENIVFSCDIDSLIWTTHRLTFNLPVQILLSPTVGPYSRIQKHNHAYVHLLVPPSVHNPDAGPVERRFPVSSIPHTAIMHAEQGQGQALTVYIMFPRMLHRAERGRNGPVHIPLAILADFWSRVVLPSIRDNVGEQSMAYVAYDAQEHRLKSATPSQRSGNVASSKAFPISPATLAKVQDAIRQRVKSDSSLAAFGSFFFVVEGKGFKHRTSSVVSAGGWDGKSPWEKLVECWPVLDLQAMKDDSTSELLLDIGFGFHPRKSLAVPVVGALRLDYVEASYGAAGCLSGDIHQANTFHRYGGMQAEYSQERSRRSGVVHRSSYMLSYETIRTRNNVPLFVADKEAYSLGDKYRSDVNRLCTLWTGSASTNSFGVRDETRVSGKVVEIILDNAFCLVCTLHP